MSQTINKSNKRTAGDDRRSLDETSSHDDQPNSSEKKQKINTDDKKSNSSKQISAASIINIGEDLIGKLGEYMNPMEFFVMIKLLRITPSVVIYSVQQYKWTPANFVTCFLKLPHYESISNKLWNHLSYQLITLMMSERIFPITYAMLSEHIMSNHTYHRRTSPLMAIISAIKDEIEQIDIHKRTIPINATTIINKFKDGPSFDEQMKIHVIALDAKRNVFKQRLTMDDVRLLILQSQRNVMQFTEGIGAEIEIILRKFPEIHPYIVADDILSTGFGSTITIALLSFRKDLISDELVKRFIGRTPRVCQYMLDNYVADNKANIMTACIQRYDYALLDLLLDKKFPYDLSEITGCFVSGRIEMCRVILKHKIPLSPNILDVIMSNPSMAEIILILVKLGYKPSVRSVCNAIMQENMLAIIGYKPQFKPQGEIEKSDLPLKLAISHKKNFYIQTLLDDGWPLPPPIELIQIFDRIRFDFDVFRQVNIHIRKHNSLAQAQQKKLAATKEPTEQPKSESSTKETLNENPKESPEEKKLELYLLPIKEIGDGIIKHGAIHVFKMLIDYKFITLKEEMVESLKTRGAIDIYDFAKKQLEELRAKNPKP